MQNGAPLQVNWHNKIDSNKLICDIHALLNQVDRTGSANICFHDSVAPSATKFCKTNSEGHPDGNGDRWMWVRLVKVTARYCKTNRDKAWWAKMVVVATDAMTRLDRKTAERCRLISYALAAKGIFDKKSVRDFGTNLALTLGRHPATIGQIADSVGRMVVPEGWQLVCYQVHNICQYNNDQSGKHLGSRRLKLEGTVEVPSMITAPRWRKLTNSDERLRAVMIIEHRNLDFVIDFVKDQLDAFKGVLFFLTGGFSSQAVRELVHLLGEKNSSKDIPFIFMSDLDFSAIQIFLNLKFGSKNMAYASGIQCCPKLEWVGPLREDLENVRDRYARVLAERAVLDNPHWSDGQKEAKRLQELHDMRKSHERYFRKGVETLVSDNDRNLARGWFKSGELDHCPLLKGVVEELIRTGRGKFRFAKLSDHDKNGIHDTMIRKIREACKETGSQHMPNVQPDTQHRAFDNLPSSLPAMPVSEAHSSEQSTSQRGSQRQGTAN